MESFKWLWGHVKRYQGWIMLGFTIVIATSALNMVNPYLSGTIVDKVIIGKKTGLLPTIVLTMIGVTFVKAVIRYGMQMIFEKVSQNVFLNIRETMYAKLQKMDFGFFDRNRTGDIMAKMTGDMDMVRHFTAWTIYNIFENLVIFIFAIVVLFSINLQFALVLVAITPVIGYFTYRLATDIKPTFSAIREQFSKLNSVVQENISGNRVVKAFAKEDYEVEKFSMQNEGFKARNMESAKISSKYVPILESLAGALSVVLILVGGIFVIKGWLTMGELVMFNSYIWALNNPMRMAGWLINEVQRFVASADKVMSLLKEEPRITNSQTPVLPEHIRGRVEFRNVSFSYGDTPVLQDISFQADPGQTIAVIGSTGAGKSTLMSLICRFYDITEGELFIDGTNIKELDLPTLRKNIAITMQDIFLFSDTIEGNIAYGVPDASMEQVVEAASIAGAHGFISGFAEGYDTIVGERGVGLSGGQKQRIALARALIKNPSILILDDTTSAVDMETEHTIQKSLKTVFRDKTTFIIAHRISSVKNADLILVLDNGRIVERGKHKELLEQQGYYYSVYMNQVGDFDSLEQAEVG